MCTAGLYPWPIFLLNILSIFFLLIWEFFLGAGYVPFGDYEGQLIPPSQ